ncbi:MAG: hypothetical protein WCL57_08460 [Chloroflexota bacterium]
MDYPSVWNVLVVLLVLFFTSTSISSFNRRANAAIGSTTTANRLTHVPATRAA